LNDWRKINRQRKKYYYCEICEVPFKIRFLYPSFWQYMKTNWSFVEKVMYSSSLVSSLSSITISVLAYKEEQKKAKVARKSSVKDFTKSKQKGTISTFMHTVSTLFLYGWPKHLKILMLVCMLTVIFGNWLIFQSWKKRHGLEIVLPFEDQNSCEGNWFKII